MREVAPFFFVSEVITPITQRGRTQRDKSGKDFPQLILRIRNGNVCKGVVRAKSGATENGAVLMMIVSNRKREPGDPESSSVFRGEVRLSWH